MLPENGPWVSSSILGSGNLGTSTENALNAGWVGAGGSAFSSLVDVESNELRREGVGVEPILIGEGRCWSLKESM
jgi:hypothetical protein